MRVTRLLLVLPLSLGLALAGCQADGLTGPSDPSTASGPLTPAGDPCDPNHLPC